MSRHPWHDLLLGEWVGVVLEVANARDTESADLALRDRLRRALQDVIDGRTGAPARLAGPVVFRLPRLGFRALQSGRVAPWVEFHDDRRVDADELQAVVLAMAVDPRARRLRRCDWEDCRRFFFARVDHRRPHSFCCEEHRRGYDLAHRDSDETAAYMRRYRAVLRQRAQKKRRPARR